MNKKKALGRSDVIICLFWVGITFTFITEAILTFGKLRTFLIFSKKPTNMQNILLLNNEILQAQIGNIRVTNKRVVFTSGKSNNFKVASIPLDQVSGSQVLSEVDNGWLVRAFISFGIAALIYLNSSQISYNFIEYAFLLPAVYGVYCISRFLKSRNSLLVIFSTGSMKLATDSSSYDKQTVMKFINVLDELVSKKGVETP